MLALRLAMYIGIAGAVLSVSGVLLNVTLGWATEGLLIIALFYSAASFVVFFGALILLILDLF